MISAFASLRSEKKKVYYMSEHICFASRLKDRGQYITRVAGMFRLMTRCIACVAPFFRFKRQGILT